MSDHKSTVLALPDQDSKYIYRLDCSCARQVFLQSDRQLAIERERCIRRDKLGNMLPLAVSGAQRAAIERAKVQAEWDRMDGAEDAERMESRLRELAPDRAPCFGGYDGESGPADCEAPMYYWDKSRQAIINDQHVALVHPLFEA